MTLAVRPADLEQMVFVHFAVTKWTRAIRGNKEIEQTFKREIVIKPK